MNNKTLFIIGIVAMSVILLYSLGFAPSVRSGKTAQTNKDWEDELFGEDESSAGKKHADDHSGHGHDHSSHEKKIPNPPVPVKEQNLNDFDLDPAPTDPALPKCPKITQFAIVTVALGPYYVFVFPFVASVEKFVFADDPCVNITVMVWTDRVSDTQWHQPFPAASMKRFAAYLNLEGLLQQQDYILHQDIDSEFIASVGQEYFVKGGMFAVAHADNYFYDGSEIVGNKDGKFITMADVGVKRDREEDRGQFFNQACVFSNPPHVCVQEPPYDGNHNARLPDGTARYYFYGGIWGGDATKTIAAFRTIAKWISDDLSVGYIPKVHDESYVNRYFAENRPQRVLTTAYMNPVLYWTHPWLFKNYKPEQVRLLDPGTCGRLHDNEYPIIFPNGWEWSCFEATEEDRLWEPRVWNMFKCNKRPCPRKPGREWPPMPADCTFCLL